MNTIKLEKGNINLMLPFRLGIEFNKDPVGENNDTWTKTDEDFPKLDFLLDHVKNFFVRSSADSAPDGSSCIIMKLKKESLAAKLFNNKNYWLSNKAFDTHEKVKNPLKYSVCFDSGSFRLIYNPFTRIAVLILNIELPCNDKNSDHPNLSDFIQVNYLVKLFNRNDEPFFISQNERPEERKKALQLTDSSNLQMFEKTIAENPDITGWRMSHLINNLLAGINKTCNIQFFDCRFYPICYAQPSREIMDDEYIHKALFYLRKVYNFDFAPAFDVLQRESELFHPFKQIYYANSLEGAAVFNNCSSSDPEFIKTFYTNSFQKSLWLTILGMMQRSVFLQLLKEVSEINPDDHQVVKEYIKRYTRITLKAIFSKVSVYHQHNDYYVMMINNFQINELQTELKEELYELNNVLQQFHADEVEKHDKIEKQSGKRLSRILFALSLISLTQVVYGILGKQSLPLYQHLLAFLIPLCLGFIFWRIISPGGNKQ